MPWIDVIWTETNEAHVARHGLSTSDVEQIIRSPDGAGISRSSGRPFVVGWVEGRMVMVVYEEIDALTVYPVTAYLLED